jgi:hypothetical protein
VVFITDKSGTGRECGKHEAEAGRGSGTRKREAERGAGMKGAGWMSNTVKFKIKEVVEMFWKVQ